MLISFNYKDGEKCLSFEEVDKALSKKKNSVKHRVKQSSSLFALTTPLGTRTLDPLIKSQMLYQLS